MPRVNAENASIKFEQSIIHKEYIEHLFGIFSYLCTKTAVLKRSDRKASNNSSYYFVTRQLVAITELHELFYKDKKKIVPMNIETLLTEISLAYWAMDDGGGHASGFILNTTSFNLNELDLLVKALKNKFDLDTSIHSRNRIYIKSNSKDRFIQLVKPHFHNSMLYKLK
jgi:hypothetical protein